MWKEGVGRSGGGSENGASTKRVRVREQKGRSGSVQVLPWGGKVRIPKGRQRKKERRSRRRTSRRVRGRACVPMKPFPFILNVDPKHFSLRNTS